MALHSVPVLVPALSPVRLHTVRAALSVRLTRFAGAHETRAALFNAVLPDLGDGASKQMCLSLNNSVTVYVGAKAGENGEKEGEGIGKKDAFKCA